MSDDRRHATGPHQPVRESPSPHAEPVVPVTEVKNVLLQTSLDQLQKRGLLAAYLQLVRPDVPEQIRATLPISWVPVSLAIAHYRACDLLPLESEVVQDLGAGVGQRMQETSLISQAKKAPHPGSDLWQSAGALRRMWGRHHRGGSVQTVKLGECEMELSLRGFVLNQFRYFREAQRAVIVAAFEAVGARDTQVRIDQYSATRDELTLRISWT